MNIQPYTTAIPHYTGRATLDKRHPRLHRFTTPINGITKLEIHPGHRRAFFGLALFGYGFGISFPVIIHVKA